jgi:hypothetical protein
LRYTRRKIRGINLSFLLAGMVFAGWALVCAWFGWPRGFRAGSTAGFLLFVLASLFFTAFPLIWVRFPEKHPVNHELARYGNREEICERLDIEMAEHFDALGPFRFTATMLVYDSGHEFQMVPYDQIVSAVVEMNSGGEPPSTPTIVVRTRSGRRYQWYRTWLQGIFDPEKTLEKIRAVAHLDETDSSTSVPSAV